MAATIIAVRDWIYNQIRTLVGGTGDYTYDLTGAGKVIRADASAPWTIDGTPCASVFFVRSVTGTEPTLCKFDRQMTFGATGFASTTDVAADTVDQLQLEEAAALNLLNDLTMAIESDRRFGGLVIRVLVDHEIQTGGATTAGLHYSTAMCIVRCNMQKETGV